MGNSAAYLSLKEVTPQWEQIVADIHAQIEDGSALGYLPATADKTVQEGYLAQLEVIAQALEHPEHPIFEMHFNSGPRSVFLLKSCWCYSRLTKPPGCWKLSLRSGPQVG